MINPRRIFCAIKRDVLIKYKHSCLGDNNRKPKICIYNARAKKVPTIKISYVFKNTKKIFVAFQSINPSNGLFRSRTTLLLLRVTASPIPVFFALLHVSIRHSMWVPAEDNLKR